MVFTFIFVDFKQYLKQFISPYYLKHLILLYSGKSQFLYTYFFLPSLLLLTDSFDEYASFPCFKLLSTIEKLSSFHYVHFHFLG